MWNIVTTSATTSFTRNALLHGVSYYSNCLGMLILLVFPPFQEATSDITLKTGICLKVKMNDFIGLSSNMS